MKNKLIIKEIKPKKKLLCQSITSCHNLAKDSISITGEPKMYVCEKCLIEFYRKLGNIKIDEE